MKEISETYFHWFCLQYPLCLLFRNENEEMVEILQDLHQRYVPLNEDGKEIREQIFFGGDQLTEERARNAQKARLDSDTLLEMLMGVLPKNEDWHAFRIAFQRTMEILSHPDTTGDAGTYFANATVTNNSNAKLSPLNEYNKVKEAFYLYLDAYIVAATMAYFGMEGMESGIMPGDLVHASKEDKSQWLLATLRPCVEHFVSLMGAPGSGRGGASLLCVWQGLQI
ncbi:uncharacterized protein LOC106164375 [Lingula anatina]|uniref:Uncharacterized protein LOC106164375 n=1 Tax=Lingula anatina TaxID=7574 RepID=A0A2R2MM70_LINAN|nr:uncharacterized protein LOC106164375 [Lingula anatina]|eukprot:XP_023931305.1 uncharacterized protein LOC106164375 [Lingula anatina]